MAAGSVSVAKHRYFKGKKAKQGTKKYIDYVTHREGHDRDKGGRLFFNEKLDAIDGRKLKKEVDRQDGRGGAVAHELILSPGLNAVDSQEYTRELMRKLERSKGQELEWMAVPHKNTDHHHIHVLIMGKDAHGSPVRINRHDYQDLREWGDRYIDREHHLDKFLERDVDRIFKEKGRGELKYEPDRGDELFNRLLFGDGAPDRSSRAKDDKPRAKDAEWDRERAIAELSDSEKIYAKGKAYTQFSSLKDLRDFEDGLRSKELKHTDRLPKEEYSQLKKWIYEKERYGEDYHERKEIEKRQRGKSPEITGFDKDFGNLDTVLKRNLEPKSRDDGALKSYKPRSQRRFERLGRQAAWHAQYESAMEKMRLQNELLRNPENREYIESQLEWLKESDKGVMTEFERVDVDELLGWGDKDKKRDRQGRYKKDRDEIKEGPDRGDELYNSLFSGGGDKEKSKKSDDMDKEENSNETGTSKDKSRDDKEKDRDDDDDRGDR
jgi:hypothetical protein